ncbi:MAG: hypothetical protein AAF664_08640 [Planctomycetota bacterium]
MSFPSCAFEIFPQWHQTNNGFIESPSPEELPIGSHAVAFNGVEINHQALMIQNSWGAGWGLHGYGFLSFEYFSRYFIGGFTMPSVGELSEILQETSSASDEIMFGFRDYANEQRTGGAVHLREVFDRIANERKGWLIAVPMDGFLDVEDFFVRPQFRQQGVARQLLRMLRDLQADLSLPIRLWIDWADWNSANESAVKWLVSELDLRLLESDNRWSACVALPTDVPTSAPEVLVGSPDYPSGGRPTTPKRWHPVCDDN